MLICKGNSSYICSNVVIRKVKRTEKLLRFTIPDIPHDEVTHLFDENTFYFYDDVLKAKLPDTDNAILSGLSITANDDLSHMIYIKLTQKGAIENES